MKRVEIEKQIEAHLKFLARTTQRVVRLIAIAATSAMVIVEVFV